MTAQLLRLPEVERLTGIKRSTLYLRQVAGLFPRPVSLGGRAVAWPKHEVESINKARIAGQSDDKIRALVAKLTANRKGGAK